MSLDTEKDYSHVKAAINAQIAQIDAINEAERASAQGRKSSSPNLFARLKRLFRCSGVLGNGF
jgi:hypothetical protein